MQLRYISIHKKTHGSIKASTWTMIESIYTGNYFLSPKNISGSINDVYKGNDLWNLAASYTNNTIETFKHHKLVHWVKSGYISDFSFPYKIIKRLTCPHRSNTHALTFNPPPSKKGIILSITSYLGHLMRELWYIASSPVADVSLCYWSCNNTWCWTAGPTQLRMLVLPQHIDILDRRKWKCIHSPIR